MNLTNIDADLYTFENQNGDRRLDYYINTTVDEALKDPKIRSKLNKVNWVHIKGFYPHSYGLKPGDLPNIVFRDDDFKKL